MSTSTRRKSAHSTSDAKPSTPYSLRENSKLPSRYRDEEIEPARTRSPGKVRLNTRNGANLETNSPSKRTKAKSLSVPKQATESPQKPVKKEEEPTDSPNSTLSTPNQATTSYGKDVTPLASQDSASNDEPQDESKAVFLKKIARQKTQSDLSEVMRENLRRLKNFLKLPRARRWVVCEFFYSGVDEQLFLGDNEFYTLIKESFPNLKTHLLNRAQWRTIRRLLGKPRRCSEAFFREERLSLEHKRVKIRSIYEGKFFESGNYDVADLPQKLPRPLVVGMRIYARLRCPKDGIYAGTIDAVTSEGYRVVFEKEDMLPPGVIPDSEVMLDGRLELVPLSYFIENATAKMSYLPRQSSVKLATQQMMKATQSAIPQKKPGSYEKVGNFPVRMLVILVKLSKLLELKRKIVKNLSDLNAEAERINLLSDSYHPTFQERYAYTVIDAEAVDRQIAVYLNGIQEYNAQLTPLIGNEVSMNTRPEVLKKVCSNHANAIVKHCNNGLNVQNQKALTLITLLTSLMLQVRALSQQKVNTIDLQTLGESISDIRQQISSKSIACMQDNVEVHMKQIHLMMTQGATKSS
ncbi:hypothetical protein WR25_07725 [Diploscapter pachys]|uniref:DIRP domain-containing protein n=1 Tax=Diploscapter pachys TaxID=2018661 RepID=A0A2A2KIR1_9BILA|nr:hypothetical protein WR25_07725 [Diploscapter pachys]